ncbi:zinc transporter ttm-1 isoform X2 [Drosophila pseudoobscura]|uniref:Zinc transporter ttm-1 isoform X2 n=1 Tax=Drosophila pseudoobscura pseudoobscura TaxID=46245 RepID=A0A6I8VSJ7_DROPS|nr:zinc transporter ttm-1 isoform X2 [Drosophila pseudoobscura]
MSKYQKLDSAEAPTGPHEDDYDERFSPYFDGNQPLSGGEQELHDSRLPARGAAHLTNDSSKYHHHHPHHQEHLNHNNNSLASTHRVAGIGSKVIRDLEEQTWEVPLLGGSEGSASNLIIEFLGGYVAGSLAIMTDAAHLATDCISFVIGLVAIWLGGRPPDERMSFGYKRYEVVGALASILGIWLLTGILVVVAIQRIYTQDFVLDVNVMMSISGIGIAINIVMMFVLHGSWLGIGGHGHGHGHSHSHSHGHGHGHGHSHSHSHSDSNSNSRSGSYALLAAGSDGSLMTATESRATIANGHNVAISNGSKPFECIGTGGRPNHERRQMSPPQPLDMEENLNLRAAMIHVIGDLVQSIGVFLAAVLIKFCPGAKYADPLCTLLFSVIVILTTVPLFRESVAVLLDAVPQNLSLRTLQRQLASIEGVRSVHHLNVWQHTAEHRVLMVHLVTEAGSNSEDILQLATQLVSGPEYRMKHATIQIERLPA